MASLPSPLRLVCALLYCNSDGNIWLLARICPSCRVIAPLGALGLPFTHKIILDKTVPAVYVFRHEPTKPNKTDPVKIQ